MILRKSSSYLGYSFHYRMFSTTLGINENYIVFRNTVVCLIFYKISIFTRAGKKIMRRRFMHGLNYFIKYQIADKGIYYYLRDTLERMFLGYRLIIAMLIGKSSFIPSYSRL